MISAASRESMREAILADEVADAAAKCDAPDPDRAGVAEPGREAVRPDGSRVFARCQARLGPRGAFANVDLEPLHFREVEHDAAIRGAVTGKAVAAAADREFQSALSRERNYARDVGCVFRLYDEPAAVDPAVEDRARLVVGGISAAITLPLRTLRRSGIETRGWCPSSAMSNESGLSFAIDLFSELVCMHG